MENIDLRTWLLLYDDHAEVKCWVECEGDEVASPNMATVTKDELFEWEDQLNEIVAGDDSFLDIFMFTDHILDELESRLQLNPNFVAEIESMEHEDFVPVELNYNCTFHSKIDAYHTARTIRELHDAENGIITCVKHKLGDLDVSIRNGILIIKQRNNISCSTSIITDILHVNAKKINDKNANLSEGIWAIDLKEI